MKRFFLSLLLLLVAHPLAAATLHWKPVAVPIKQVYTVTMTDTWDPGDQIEAAIGNETLVVVIGSEDTTDNVAAAFANAWNATTRLTGATSPNATSNFGGAERGVFYEFEASYASNVVTLTARTPGKIFKTVGGTDYLTITDVGDGTATLAEVQAASGPYSWNNAENWDTGDVPDNDDIVVFRDTNISCRYGLPVGSLEVTVITYQTFEGIIGNWDTNIDTPGKPYEEYRATHLVLDESGTGTNIAHLFGLGDAGNGSPLIRIAHSGVKCSPTVFNTGTPQQFQIASYPFTFPVNILSGRKALELSCSDNTSTLKLINGSVQIGLGGGVSSAFLTVEQTGGDLSAINAMHTTGASFTQAGGKAVLGGSGAIATVTCRSGEINVENQTGTVTNLLGYGGTIRYSSANTVTNLLLSGGALDLRKCPGVTVTNGSIYPGSKLWDPYRKISSNNFLIYFDLSPDIQFGGTANTPFVIDPTP